MNDELIEVEQHYNKNGELVKRWVNGIEAPVLPPIEKINVWIECGEVNWEKLEKMEMKSVKTLQTHVHSDSCIPYFECGI